MLVLLLAACGAVEPAPWPDSTWVDPGVAEVPAGEDSGAGANAAEAATVLLNELMASNDSTVEDEWGEEDDWVELLNVTDAALDISGYGLSLEGEGPAWVAPAGTTLSPGGHLVLWLDGEPDQGPLHGSLSLASSGGTLLLLAPADAGGDVIDRVEWAELGTDIALARTPDAGPAWAPTIQATPGNANPHDPGSSLDPSDLLFDGSAVRRLDISLPQASRDALASDPYTYVEGAVSFRGATLSPVGVRIKGQSGSYRPLTGKSALKIDMTSFGGTARLAGLDKLTLNNMVQDGSLVHETLAYTQFRDMGVPAPRTAHLAVYLDGEYRGIYLHVESADELFLARWFDDAEGNLYEGEYGEDLTLDSYTRLEQDERGANDPDDYSDLAALAALLDEDPDEALVETLEALVDVDEVLDMWAVEVMIGHWDGYFWYPNNYRVYHDPSTGRLSLLPWGTDQTYDYKGDVEAADGALARWCLQIPSVRARYLLALWRAADRMQALPLDALATDTHALVAPWLAADPYAEVTPAQSRSQLGSTRSYLLERPDEVLDALFPDGVPDR